MLLFCCGAAGHHVNAGLKIKCDIIVNFYLFNAHTVSGVIWRSSDLSSCPKASWVVGGAGGED